ncbi:ATP-binding response regulator [Oceanobacillus timonensis]|uniref:ATP-binding response regulator n=1 Tax=Oceanobacillus timonensis TaxID=1926285 RepID=UPI0009B9D998|nr:ATP-binding protein [Oceanobacillus timonensis]
MKNNYVKLGLILLLVFACLSAFRLIWMDVFQSSTPLDIEEGELDLRDWDTVEKETLLLDGEWNFYPFAFLMDENETAPVPEETVKVPDGWNNILGSSTGYGTYRLQINVPSGQDRNYQLYIPSIRSASDIYINGEQLSSSGKIAAEKEGFIAENSPQSVVFTANEEGVIDIVIQAANYKDIRSFNSGIIRSIRFGTEEALTNEVQFSIYMQIAMVIVLLIHSRYAFILYLIGNQDKRLLFFSLLTFIYAVLFLLSGKEKLLHAFFYTQNDWGIRFFVALVLIECYIFLQCTNHQKLPYWNKIFPYFQWGVFGLAAVTLFLPLTLSQMIVLLPAYLIAGCGLVGIGVLTMIRSYKQSGNRSLFLIISCAAVIHQLIWALIWRGTGEYMPHYPFDLIVAIVCFMVVWFKGYFRVHEETKELAATLQRMNQEKDQFLANTSHEFRNPLNSILLLSKAVRDREETAITEQSRNDLNTVLNVGNRMNLLLTDLLEERQLQQGQPRLDKQVIKLEPIVTGVIDLLQFSSNVKKVQIINRISKTFPPVYADENRLTQILFNLIKNAIKFTDQGNITISATVNGDIAEIHVTDTGIGISREMQKRLFLPYEQEETPEGMTREGGFGLGLSITKQLVELHGGTIRVASVKGEKTTFTFTLELAFTQEESIPLSGENKRTIKVNEETEQMETPPPLQHDEKPSILAVDDDPASLLALQAVLPDDLYHLVLVSSPDQALKELEKGEWDMVISDIMMPKISGYKLTRTIRESYSLTELPILLLTGGNSDIQAAFAAGANDYITKPVEATELKTRLNSLITLKRVAEQQLQLETMWLQAQIQPHFLFNTLNAIRALSEWDLEEMRKLLDEFGNLLRSKFQFQQMHLLIPLEEELRLVHSYLYIEQVRFGEALQVKWDLENAVQHGIRQGKGKGTVSIRLKREAANHKAMITVEDDGTGMEEEEITAIFKGESNSESGVGIINLEKRLHRHYGKGLTIDSAPGQGTKVSFEIDTAD